MFNLLEDQFINSAVSRAEQSRISYNLQKEEFRSLNESLQIYLNDIKTIDDSNRRLQENIEQIRTNYILTLENLLKRLPNDFHEQSQILNEAHIDRYTFKSRSRRLINEREEIKRRIHFIASDEKEQLKRLSHLQKKERVVHNEFMELKEKLQNCLNYIEIEKQNHRQAMNKVDNLQVQLEKICIERSKTEVKREEILIIIIIFFHSDLV